MTWTGIGRTVRSQTTVTPTIKRVDRLLSTPHLHRARALLDTALIQQVLGPQTRPVIIVEWSDLTPDRRGHVVRASLPVGGRALTRYDNVPPLQTRGNRRVLHAFVRTLHRVLPAKVTPILGTDAGVRSSWFLAGTQRGWTFVGRVRTRDRVCCAPPPRGSPGHRCTHKPAPRPRRAASVRGSARDHSRVGWWG